MARYFTRPKAWVEDEDAWGAESPVGVPLAWENKAIDTGLLDAQGDYIMRAANPVGFGKDEEW